jgi:hypothetical protein
MLTFYKDIIAREVGPANGRCFNIKLIKKFV